MSGRRFATATSGTGRFNPLYSPDVATLIQDTKAKGIVTVTYAGTATSA